MKRRFVNILEQTKKKKGYLFLVGILTITLALGTACGSASETDTEAKNSEIMQNTSMPEETSHNQIDNHMDTAEFFTEDRIENTSRLSDILTVEYKMEDLEGFFGRASSNESVLSGVMTSDVRIASANEKFPIECLRRTDDGFLYSVYRVKEGGLYYVFWADIFDNTDAKDTIVDWAVYFTAYLPTPIDLSADDFETIMPNSSTAADIGRIDPNFELSFLLSSRIVSYSLLEDGTVIQICYDFDRTLETKEDLIVTSKEILLAADTSSRLAAVYYYDLP